MRVEPGRWRANSWWHQISGAIEEMIATVPSGETFILVDEEHWGIGDDLAGRRRIPLPEPADLAPIPRPRIGYSGWIKPELDWDLLDGVAGDCPEYCSSG